MHEEEMRKILVYFRYKYLEKMHEEEMSKILVYLKGFTDDERLRLAQITALWLASGQIPASTLRVLINVSLVSKLVKAMHRYLASFSLEIRCFVNRYFETIRKLKG